MPPQSRTCSLSQNHSQLFEKPSHFYCVLFLAVSLVSADFSALTQLFCALPQLFCALLPASIRASPASIRASPASIRASPVSGASLGLFDVFSCLPDAYQSLARRATFPFCHTFSLHPFFSSLFLFFSCTSLLICNVSPILRSIPYPCLWSLQIAPQLRSGPFILDTRTMIS